MSRVSVIIPTYNRADILGETLESVLAQDYEDLEVIVVDDGSTDNTAEMVRRHGSKLRYIRQQNAGPSVARNLGLLHATGEYLVFLDSDDLLLPDAVRKLAAALDNNPSHGLAYCGCVETSGPGSEFRRTQLDMPSGDVFGAACRLGLSVTHLAMVRKSCLARVGVFDTALTNFWDDVELFIRIAAVYECVFVPEHLGEYRLMYNALSKTGKRLREQKQYIYDRLRAYNQQGRLSENDLAAARRIIFGFRPSEKLMRDAGIAYRNGDFKTAFPLALQAAGRDPRYLFSRTWGSVFVKSCLGSIRGKKRPRMESAE